MIYNDKKHTDDLIQVSGYNRGSVGRNWNRKEYMNNYFKQKGECMQEGKINGRIIWIDWAKTICIFLMVVGHWTQNSILLLYIYSFHMPALFVVSGILFKPHPWKKTLLSFGIPIAFYSLINILFLLTIGELHFENLFTKDVFFRFFHYRYGLNQGFYCGDWFLWALLGLRLLFGDIGLFSPLRKFYMFICIFVIAYMCLENYLIRIDTIFRGWYIGRLVPSLPFFCLGFYIKDHCWKPKSISSPTLYLLGLIMALTPIINGYSSINSNNFGLSYAIFFIGSSLSSLFLFSTSRFLPKSNFIASISNGTLFILGLHIPIMRTLEFIFPSLHEFLPILVIPICYFPILLLEQKYPALLGKV